jgi:hypothetical protein
VAHLTEVTASGYLDGLEGWGMDEIRARRNSANELEISLSYLRRIIQGRLDIVLAELRHRASGEPGGVSELVSELPSILGENVHAPGNGRLPLFIGPGEMDPEMERQLEEIFPAGRLAALGDVDDQDLRDVAEKLNEMEHSVSASRRSVFDVIDRLQEELVRRYSSGEATVDDLLS